MSRAAARCDALDEAPGLYRSGDLAENGWACEYAILADALARHPHLPVRLIPGDHDRQRHRRPSPPAEPHQRRPSPGARAA